jgi:hypothetical protein
MDMGRIIDTMLSSEYTTTLPQSAARSTFGHRDELFRQTGLRSTWDGPHGLSAAAAARVRRQRLMAEIIALRAGRGEQRETGPGTPQPDQKGRPEAKHNKRSISNEVADKHDSRRAVLRGRDGPERGPIGFGDGNEEP